MPNEYKLDSKWTFYIHLQNDDNWDYSGYHNIITLDTVEQAVLLNEELSFELIKKTKYCELGVVECHNCQTNRITKKISFLTFEISCPECGAFF
jgi:hypothetical protein